MKLVHRVSLFFLGALALSLAGNGVLLYVLVRHFLDQRFEQQLHSALHTLVAAVEVEDDDVKWEPSDHTIALGSEDGLDDIRWIVADGSGRLVDSSRNLVVHDARGAQLVRMVSELSDETDKGLIVGDWHVLHQTLAAPHPKPASERVSKEFDVLRIMVARSPAQVQVTLRQLAHIVGALSVGIFMFAAIVGTWYCRRAIRPVREMARHARHVKEVDFRIRLPPAPHADELSELGNAFNGLLDQLQQAFEKLHRFTGDAAHQLRTPITVLLGQIDVTLRRPRTVEEYQQTLSLLRAQAAELQQIVETLLFLARVAGESELPAVETHDCREWLTKYISRWRDHVRSNDLELIAVENGHLTTSWPLVTQILDNLIGNAFKYSPPGTSVRLQLHCDSSVIRFQVSDQGAGIDPKELPHIFEPFYRTDSARHSGLSGSGLGLAICAAIAKSLKAELTCSSAPGAGSCFTLKIST